MMIMKQLCLNKEIYEFINVECREFNEKTSYDNILIQDVVECYLYGIREGLYEEKEVFFRKIIRQLEFEMKSLSCKHDFHEKIIKTTSKGVQKVCRKCLSVKYIE